MAQRTRLFDEDAVTALRTELESAKGQAKRRLSRREVVAQLKADLEELLRSGWTADEIVELLAKKDFKISAAMLREYLREPKTKTPAAGKGRMNAPKASSAAAKSKAAT